MPKTCSHCGDRGYVVREDGSAHTCACRILREDLRTTCHVLGLEKIEKLGRGLLVGTDPIEGSALIHQYWSEFRADLAGWVFARIRKGDKPKVRVLTCVELRKRYLASEISDLNDDLVIVRLLGIRNEMTLAGLIELAATLPMVWILAEPRKRYAEGHVSWSPDIAALIEDWPRVDLATARDPKTATERMGL